MKIRNATEDQLLEFVREILSQPRASLSTQDRYDLRKINDEFVRRDTQHMKNQSRYILTKTEKSRCPHCNKHVDLLSTDEDILHGLKHSHWFYICWHCKRVYEIGRGEVKRDESKSVDAS